MPKKPRALADRVEAINRQIEEAIRIDLFAGIQKVRASFAQGSDAEAFAQAIERGDARAVSELVPFKVMRGEANLAADKVGLLSPRTRAEVRQGIKGGFVGPGLTNDLVTKPINFDAALPSASPSLANARDAVHQGARRVVHQSKEVKDATRTRFATYLQDLTKPTRKLIQDTIVATKQNKFSLGEAKAQIRDVIGLTQRQGQAVRRTYQNQLDFGFDAKRAGEEMLAHSERLLDYRAETIAVTETRTLSETIKQSEWLGLEGAGGLGENPMVTWILGALDDKTCPVCIAVANTQMPLGMPFVLSNGIECLPGFAHPRCRCYSMLTTDDDGEDAPGKVDGAELPKRERDEENQDDVASRA